MSPSAKHIKHNARYCVKFWHHKLLFYHIHNCNAKINYELEILPQSRIVFKLADSQTAVTLPPSSFKNLRFQTRPHVGKQPTSF
jgi:hypothetical protein